jgi:DNA-binding NtrC family response regulator
MESKLIITGWLVDFACAAAVTLVRHPDSEILPLSRNALPLHLDGLSSSRLPKYSEIFILGVPLQSPNEALLRTALSRLRKNGIRVSWYCSYPLPVQMPKETLELIEARISTEEKELCRFMAEELKLPLRLANIQNITRIAREDAGTTDADRQRRILLEAGMSRYRRFQELQPFIDAVKTVSANSPLSEIQNRLIDEYVRFGHRELRGSSRAIAELKKLVKLVGADSRCSVMICGETGTGKETVASLIHGHSTRRSEPFIEFNCAMMSPQLAESALFGHEKGAFTGAEKKHIGVFEQADGGTLFLDEIGDLPLEIQAGILRVMQESRFRRLGGTETIKTDVRIIAATNRNLQEMIKRKEFREDLLYRLDVIHIEVSPLRERPEDIEAIANSFLYDRKEPRLSRSELDELKAYRWPGNVRELINILERSLVLKNRRFAELLSAQKLGAGSGGIASENLHDNTLTLVRNLYEKYGQNKMRAAKALGITVNTLKKYLAENNIRS